MEVYVNDMLAKSRAAKHYITDLQEIFSILQRFQMKLNLDKCAFEVTFRKFLNFMMSQCGVEANLEKIQTLLEKKPLKMIKKV